MAKYSAPSDYTDSAIRVGDTHRGQADALVDANLWQLQIDPASITLPQPLLTRLAVAYASQQAAYEQGKGQESYLVVKGDSYGVQAKQVAKLLTRAALGLDATPVAGAGLGSIPIGRG